MSSSEPSRSQYHHGDLRNALIEAAASLAREGGPSAVTIRAAARAVGVTPTAAYRHFAGHEELLDAAKDEAMVRLGNAMNTELRARGEVTEPAARAMGNLAAIGRGYVDFAVTQTGLFRTAFCDGGKVMPPLEEHPDYSPFRKLVHALDDLVACGYLAPERRPLAEYAAWSLAHGIASLFVDGPMRESDAATKEEILTRSLVIFGRGLGSGISADEMEAIVARSGAR